MRNVEVKGQRSSGSRRMLVRIGWLRLANSISRQKQASKHANKHYAAAGDTSRRYRCSSSPNIVLGGGAAEDSAELLLRGTLARMGPHHTPKPLGG